MPEPETIQVVRSPTQFVDSVESLETFLQDLCQRINKRSYLSWGLALYIDLEGIDLCRYGRISLLTMLVREHRWEMHENCESHRRIVEMPYLLDIKTLGASTFSTVAPVPAEDSEEDSHDSGSLSGSPASFPGESPPNDERYGPGLAYGEVRTLKEILECPDVPKCFFDVRNDADALFAHFGIHLRGTLDLQLLENYKRHLCRQDTRYVKGLAGCVREDSKLDQAQKQAWELTKENGRRMFAPERGGKYAVFDERPLNPELVKYCVQDVLCMPGLWAVYRQMLPIPSLPEHRRMVKTATKMRVKEAESASYDPRSRTKVLAPDWTKVVYDPHDSDEDYDPPSPPETGRDFEGIWDSE